MPQFGCVLAKIVLVKFLGKFLGKVLKSGSNYIIDISSNYIIDISSNYTIINNFNDWLYDISANRYLKSYFNGFVDISGDLIIRKDIYFNNNQVSLKNQIETINNKLIYYDISNITIYNEINNINNKLKYINTISGE